MKKLISAFALTVAVFGTSFAEDVMTPQSLQASHGLRVSMKQQSMTGSFFDGCGFSQVKVNADPKEAAAPTLVRVNSKEDLVADEDSDDEALDVKAKIIRQNSQEDLTKLGQKEQSSGWGVTFKNTLVSVKNAFVSALQTVKSWFW